MQTENQLLLEILQNQHIIYAKLLKIEDKTKGYNSSDRIDDAAKELKLLREAHFPPQKG